MPMPRKAPRVNFSYAAYQFRPGEQDPIVDRLRTIYEDHNGEIKKVSELSGVSKTTIANWWNGKTKRPQFATTAAVARSLGYDFVLAPRTNGHDSVSASTVGVIVKRFPRIADLRAVST